MGLDFWRISPHTWEGQEPLKDGTKREKNCLDMEVSSHGCELTLKKALLGVWQPDTQAWSGLGLRPTVKQKRKSVTVVRHRILPENVLVHLISDTLPS